MISCLLAPMVRLTMLHHIRRDILGSALERTGIERKKGQHGFHLFRHTSGSMIYEETGDLKLGQEFLRHSTVRMTGDVYTHTDGAARRATELLARIIVGDSDPILTQSSERVQ